MAKKKTSKPAPPPSVSEVLRDAIRAHKTGTAYAVAQTTRQLDPPGVSIDSIDRFLKGERDLRLETVDRLARALGLRLVKVDAPAGT